MQYALNDNEFTNSLFTKGGTCNGFYKRTVRGFKLFSMQKELIAFVRLVKEPMLMNATKRDDGKTWYSYTSTKTELYLGFDKGMGLEHERAEVLALKALHFD